MDVLRAATYTVRNPLKARGFAKIWLLTPIPIFGMMWGTGYAVLTLRRMLKGNGDRDLPDANADWRLFLPGIYATMLSLICSVVAALLCGPLFFSSDPSNVSPMAPALIQAVAGPTDLLVTAIAAVFGAIVLTRYALTDSFLAALNPLEAWSHLRAEPSIWIFAAVVGFLACNVPAAVVWVLPLRGDWDVLATIFASSYLWMFGMMINVHLLGQAYDWSRRTAAKRAARMGYRW
jgi:hypothetical protein